MRSTFTFISFALVAFIAAGCVVIAHHSFTGLGAPEEAHHALTISAGQFYKSSEGEWHYHKTSSQRDPRTTDWPYAFAIHSEDRSFDVLKFSVRDGGGAELAFTKLAPVIDDYPSSKNPSSIVLLVPAASVAEKDKPVLKTGVYRIEVSYSEGGKEGHATWTIHHEKNVDTEAWEMPTCYMERLGRKRPNQSPEPMVMSVTPRADARVAPATTMAHL